MRIAVPSADDSGLDAPLFDHFGRAPFYVIVDTDTGSVESIQNRSKHMGGTKMPPTFVAEHDVDAALAGHIGRRGIVLFGDQDIDVYRAEEGTVADAVDRLEAGALDQLGPEDGHAHGHGHGHGHDQGHQH